MTRPADRCPGVFATHEAADGRLARIRLSGGRIDAERLDLLAAAAEEFGDGHLEYTVRANLQVRGIPDHRVDAFAQRLLDAELVGDARHDRVRNLTVSPMAGRVGSATDAAIWATADRLDALLQRHDWTGRLSGRFWFGLDDGRGDVLARVPDLVGMLTPAGDAEVVVAGRHTGRVVSLQDLPGALLQVTEHFLELRDDEWRIADLSGDDLERLHGRVGELGTPEVLPPPVPYVDDPRVGWFTQADERVLLGAVTPFARLSARQAQFVAAVGAPVIFTPDREVLIADLTDGVAETVVRVLAPMGLDFDANSPWTRLSACTGSPGCAKSRADVRSLLAERVATDSAPDGREHWVGCERGCGAPAGARVRVLGTLSEP